MDGKRSGGRAGRKRARTGAMKAAVTLVLLSAPHIPSAEALKLESISEERGHLGVGLLRAVEVVRGRYERAWALVSASEPSAEDLDIALELLQVCGLMLIENQPGSFVCVCVLIVFVSCVVFVTNNKLNVQNRKYRKHTYSKTDVLL